MSEHNDLGASPATDQSDDQPDVNALKLLGFAAIGYLRCLREGVCHTDEVYRVIGQPRILDNLREVGASGDLVALINGLDEPGLARVRMSSEWFDSTIDGLLNEAEAVIRSLGPPDHRSAPPTLALIVKVR